MKKISQIMIGKIKNKKGSAAILACAVVICLFLLFSVISEYLRLQIIAKDVRDATQSAIVALAIANYDDVFTGLREVYSGGFKLVGILSQVNHI